jgi:hypothetical protein
MLRRTIIIIKFELKNMDKEFTNIKAILGQFLVIL